MSKKRKFREHEEKEPTHKAKEETKEEDIVVEKDLQEEEVVEEVKDQGHNEETEPEAVVINTITVAELKDLPSKDKEDYKYAQEEALEDAPQEAQEEKQTTEEILDTATSTATAEGTEVVEESAKDTEVIAAPKEDTEVADAELQLPVIYTQEQIKEQEILKTVTLIFQDTTKMDYLKHKMMMDSGRTLELSDEHRVETDW